MLGSGMQNQHSRWNSREERVAMAWAHSNIRLHSFSGIVTCNKNIKFRTIKIISAKQKTFKLHAMLIFIFFLLQVCLVFIGIVSFYLVTKQNSWKITQLCVVPFSLFLLCLIQGFLCKVSPVAFLFTAVICQNPPKFTVSVGISSILDLEFVK